MKEVYSNTKKFMGFKDKNVEIYLGIPYASSPIKNLRFKAPKKLDSSFFKYTLNCKEYPSNPIQTGLSNVSEDCLKLNIWKPVSKKNRLPIMVWIYGGSFETGGIGEKGAGFGLSFDGKSLAIDTQCIIITINYRLNVLGFLDFSSLDNRFDSNIGLKDIMCALEWIQDNASEFCGDTTNVTLFGQSAGGALVGALSKIPSAQHLFHKMIIQSACLESFYTKEEAANIAKKYLRLLQIPESKVGQLLTLPAKKLISVNTQLEKEVRQKVLGTTTFCPVVDEKFLTSFPYLGEYQCDKPLIIGTTKNEGRLFTRFSKDISKENGKRFLPYFAKEERNIIYSNYVHFPSFKTNSKVITDLMYTVPKYWMIDQRRESATTYAYRFDFYSGIFKLLRLKACHASDVPILFNIGSAFYLEKIVTAKRIGITIRHYWGNFARTGSPNGNGLMTWEPYTKKSKNILIFNKKNRLETDPDKKVKDIYHEYNNFFHDKQ